MSTTAEIRSSSRKPLRVWPGLAAAALAAGLLTLSWASPRTEVFGVPLAVTGLLAAVGGALVILLWWLFFSRARLLERLAVPLLMAGAIFVTRPVLHQSIAGAGMGYLFVLYAVCTMALVLVLWAVANRRPVVRLRLVSLAVAMLLGSGIWAVARTSGMSGEGDIDLHWRWTPTPEEVLLARGPLIAREQPDRPAVPAPLPSVAPPPAPEAAAPASDPPAEEPRVVATTAKVAKPMEMPRLDAVAALPVWPGFRGPARDSVVRDLSIETDWSRTPPVEMWRRPIGPGWSSFAVSGELVYTQEQRGDSEIVSAYRLRTGAPVWVHRDEVRFYEANGGPGPRATPTVHAGRVYTVGATGILNALDAATGAVAWSRDAAADTGKAIPDWGIAGSPVVSGNLVIVAVAGRLAAYDADSGEPRWMGPEGGGGYSSPQLAVIDGVEQVLLLRGSRTISVAPADGRVLWDHTWERSGSIVQPAAIGNDVLIAGVDPVGLGGLGIRRISVSRSASGWGVEERWTSRALKPYFNDFVVHEGHAYGFDGSILACMDLADGARKWKGGRYGHGQMVLLPEQDLLLVLAEEGDVALVRAAPDGFAEIARFHAIEGKTWNHPVVAGDVLLVRNGQEMAAYRLPVAGGR